MPRKKIKSSAAAPKPLARDAASPGCDQVFAALSGYVDAGLRKKMCAELGRHLGECEACLQFLQSLRDLVGGMEKKFPHGDAARVRRALLAQYRSALKSAKPRAGAR